MSWVVRFGDDSERTLTTDEVVDAYNQGRIDPETYVWTEGMPNWQPLQAVDDLVDALHEQAARDSGAHQAAHQPHGRGGGAVPDEDSALFSLAMLVTDKPPETPSDAPTEDSGLIDLTALAASAAQPATNAAPAMLLAPAMFPLEAAPPIQHAPANTTVSTHGNEWIIRGLIAAVAVLSAVLLFAIVRGSGTASNAPTASETPPPTTEATTIAAPGPSTVAADSSAKAAGNGPPDQPADATVVAARTPESAKRPALQPTTQPTQVGPPVVAPTAVTTPPKGCPCAADDLMCNMMCATKR